MLTKVYAPQTGEPFEVRPAVAKKLLGAGWTLTPTKPMEAVHANP